MMDMGERGQVGSDTSKFSPDTTVPTLEHEIIAQQELAVSRLTPGIIVALASFGTLGIAKYWAHIPLGGGILWAGILALLLGGAAVRHWRQRTGRRLLLEGTMLHKFGFVWTMAVGAHFAWGVTFAMPLDDAVGRTTFAIMALGLAGMTLASTYMVPRLTVAFLAPIIVAALYGALVSDPAVSALQKVLTMTGFVVTATIIVRVNWLIFRSGVAVMVDRERHRLEVMERRSEMTAASNIQRRLLPDPRTLAGDEIRFKVAVDHRSAQEMTGDLYDFFMIDADRLFFMVGDVCGKGVTSSLLMAMTKIMMKSAVLRHDRPLGEVFGEVGRELLREDHDSQFVTCFAGILDARTGVIHFCNAGHEPARIISADRQVENPTHSPRVGGPPLCAFDDMPYESGRLCLSPGSTLLIVTDGVTEAQDAAGNEFGGNRLDRELSMLDGDTGHEAIVSRISGAIADFVGEHDQSDDLTMLAVSWHGPSD